MVNTTSTPLCSSSSSSSSLVLVGVSQSVLLSPPVGHHLSMHFDAFHHQVSDFPPALPARSLRKVPNPPLPLPISVILPLPLLFFPPPLPTPPALPPTPPVPPPTPPAPPLPLKHSQAPVVVVAG